MFSFKLLLAFPEQIDWMKADLIKYYPNIKSSHRVEALARALGFKTYAALRAADFLNVMYGESVLVDVNWSAFNAYLKEKGFHATAKPLFLAVGRASIRLTLESKDWDYKLLTHEGFYIDTSHEKEGTPQARIQARMERFKRAREDMLLDSSVEEFLRAYSVVSRIPYTRTVTTKRGAGSLKHIAEEVSFTYPDGEVSPPSYVATGSLIFAALSAGFYFKPVDGSQSVDFNMLQSAIEDLECEIRPNGPLAESRKEIPVQNRNGWVLGKKCYEYTFKTFEPESQERDFGLAFRCLGVSNGFHYYLSYTRKSIIALTAEAHTLKNLTKLDTIEAWKASPKWKGKWTGKRVPTQVISDLMWAWRDHGRAVDLWRDEIKKTGRWKALQ